MTDQAQTALPIDIKARSFGTNFNVSENPLDKSRLRLSTPDYSIQMSIPREVLPMLEPGDTVLIFLNAVKVSAAQPPEPKATLLLPDTSIIKPNGSGH